MAVLGPGAKGDPENPSLSHAQIEEQEAEAAKAKDKEKQEAAAREAERRLTTDTRKENDRG